LLAVQDNDQVVIEESKTGKELGRIPVSGRNFHNQAFTSDGKTFAILPCEDDKAHTLELWDLPAMRTHRTLPVPICDPFPLLFSPDSRTVVLGMPRGKQASGLFIVEVATGQVRQEIRFDKILPAWTWPPDVFFTPDGEYLLIGDGAAGVAMVDPLTGELLHRRRDHRGHVGKIVFSLSRRLIATMGGDTTVLVWNADDFLRPARPKPLNLKEADLLSLWQDLGSPDAPTAAAAMRKMTRATQQCMQLLGERLQPAIAPMVDAKKLSQWLADLDNDVFDTRKKAEAEIEKLGDSARSALEQTLAGEPSIEVRRAGERLLAKLDLAGSPSQRRVFRAVEVLERIGTHEAQQLLRNLAGGDRDARLTREAKAALQRLDRSNRKLQEK
jgi:hypothetical protein